MSPPQVDPDVLQIPHLKSGKFQTWSTSFDEKMRREQISDDLFAAKTVSRLLVAIVTFGVVFGAIGVLLAI